MSMLFQPHDKNPKDQYTDKNIKQDAYVDQHRDLAPDGQGQ